MSWNLKTWAVYVLYHQCLIHHCPLVVTTRILHCAFSLTHLPFPFVSCFAEYDYWTTILLFSLNPLMGKFTQLASMPGLMDVSCVSWKVTALVIHPFIPSGHVVICVSYPLNHFFLAFSHPPLPTLLLLPSDNHPGSAPILQLAASSFQNPGAPPHETKSKFLWSSERRLKSQHSSILFCCYTQTSLTIACS